MEALKNNALVIPSNVRPSDLATLRKVFCHHVSTKTT